MASFPLLFLGLLLVPPYLAAAQQKQKQQMLSFSANESAWSPTDGSRTLVSSGGEFAAGFVRSPSAPGSYRFAVWVVAAPNNSTVWYAHSSNSGAPLEGDGASVLAIDAAGKLSWTTAGRGNRTIWSRNEQPGALLRLNDSGSLVLGPSAAWSSFEEPTDTLMAGQAIPDGGNSNTTLQSANGRYKLVQSMALKLNGNLTYANISSGSSLLNLTDDGKIQLSGGNQLIASDQGSR